MVIDNWVFWFCDMEGIFVVWFVGLGCVIVGSKVICIFFSGIFFLEEFS